LADSAAILKHPPVVPSLDPGPEQPKQHHPAILALEPGPEQPRLVVGEEVRLPSQEDNVPSLLGVSDDVKTPREEPSTTPWEETPKLILSGNPEVGTTWESQEDNVPSLLVASDYVRTPGEEPSTTPWEETPWLTPYGNRGGGTVLGAPDPPRRNESLVPRTAKDVTSPGPEERASSLAHLPLTYRPKIFNATYASLHSGLRHFCAESERSKCFLFDSERSNWEAVLEAERFTVIRVADS
jgi:hypothetical protein